MQQEYEYSDKGLIALAIIIASIILSVGIYFTYRFNKKTEIQEPKKEIHKIEKVNKNDHIIGSKNAELYVIEYFDLECPGCKAFHKQIQPLIKKYKDNKKVAFVFRHFPLYKTIDGSEPLHPTSGIEAKATECAAKLKGEDAFYKMVDKIFETTKSDGHYPVTNLVKLANDLGITTEEFSKCINSKEINDKIENAWKKAYEAKIKNTPEIYIQVPLSDDDINIIPSREAIDKIIQSYLNK